MRTRRRTPPGKWRLTAQTASALDQGPAQQVERDNEYPQHRHRRKQRYIGNTEEAKAEAADHVDNRVKVRQRLPEWRQQGQGVKHPAEVGQRRQHEGGDQADIIKQPPYSPAKETDLAHAVRARRVVLAYCSKLADLSNITDRAVRIRPVRPVVWQSAAAGSNRDHRRRRRDCRLSGVQDRRPSCQRSGDGGHRRDSGIPDQYGSG